MGCNCGKDRAVVGALGYKVVVSDGRCALTVNDEVCRVFTTATAAASAARSAGLSTSWTVVPVRGM